MFQYISLLRFKHLQITVISTSLDVMRMQALSWCVERWNERRRRGDHGATALESTYKINDTVLHPPLTNPQATANPSARSSPRPRRSCPTPGVPARQAASPSSSPPALQAPVHQRRAHPERLRGQLVLLRHLQLPDHEDLAHLHPQGPGRRGGRPADGAGVGEGGRRPSARLAGPAPPRPSSPRACAPSALDDEGRSRSRPQHVVAALEIAVPHHHPRRRPREAAVPCHRPHKDAVPRHTTVHAKVECLATGYARP